MMPTMVCYLWLQTNYLITQLVKRTTFILQFLWVRNWVWFSCIFWLPLSQDFNQGQYQMWFSSGSRAGKELLPNMVVRKIQFLMGCWPEVPPTTHPSSLVCSLGSLQLVTLLHQNRQARGARERVRARWKSLSFLTLEVTSMTFVPFCPLKASH